MRTSLGNGSSEDCYLYDAMSTLLQKLFANSFPYYIPLKYNVYIIKGSNCSCLHVVFDPVKSTYKVSGHSVHTQFLWETLGICYVHTVPFVELKGSHQVNQAFTFFFLTPTIFRA